MDYLRDKIKLKGKINILSIRLDSEGTEDMNMLAEYFQVRKGELIKLALSSMNVRKVKNQLLNDSEHKMKKQCEELR